MLGSVAGTNHGTDLHVCMGWLVGRTMTAILEREERELHQALDQCESIDPLSEPFIVAALHRLQVLAQ